MAMMWILAILVNTNHHNKTTSSHEPFILDALCYSNIAGCTASQLVTNFTNSEKVATRYVSIDAVREESLDAGTDSDVLEFL